VTPPPGTVYLVGAGPGDRGLMTLRAVELIAAADVVLFDKLIPEGALAGAREDAPLVDVECQHLRPPAHGGQAEVEFGIRADEGQQARAGAADHRSPGSSGAASGYDDTRPVGVPARFQGAPLPGSDQTAMDASGGDVSAGLESIRAHDPAFDENAFLARVERVFFVVQQAWMQCNPMMSRQVMADGIWQQHRAQIENYVARGQHNVLDGLAIGNAQLTAAHTDATFDTVTVRIRAASADYDVDDKTGHVVRGNRDVQEWQEDWLFQRSSKAVTKPGGGLGEQRCPNCGAPLDVDLAGVCSYCRAAVMSGAYDWVLSRIEQV